MRNYYASLCTRMYEILHKEAPKDELEFYLAYAKKGERILEPLCGSGRFLVPFLQRGFDISGMDSSKQMLDALKAKAPCAKVMQADFLDYPTKEKFDYIFIPSGSIGLFSDMQILHKVLCKLKELLKQKGKLVFGVDTIFTKLPNDNAYKENVCVKTKEGFSLHLKSKNFYEELTQTQFSPGIYELYDGDKLLKTESMDFVIHLYKIGEMEQYLKKVGFKEIKVYSSFDKKIAKDIDNEALMLLYECSF
ncbi:class I SAM-dependent methyltransferase [Helicobacter burdigaliensis]|uniref:class I SAM-dependent methyltransferase n=1 Tax=Helicobacter burdigaliensis TaxID=2315334 RepID=UPI0018E5096F|nr:class I SAM-dependent methyltransferase [Helicobacter burdigaliensis]